MLIKFNATRILSFKNLTIVPGIQEISQETYAAMQASKGTKAKFESGELEVIDGTEGLDAIGAFLVMSPSQVKRIIKQTNDLRLLSNWLARETRESVKGLVKERIDVLSVVEYRDGSKGKLELPPPEPLENNVTESLDDDDIFGDAPTEKPAAKKPPVKKPPTKTRGK